MEYEIVNAFQSLNHSLREAYNETYPNLMHVTSKYSVERNIYIVGGYSTHPYEVVNTFPLGKSAPTNCNRPWLYLLRQFAELNRTETAHTRASQWQPDGNWMSVMSTSMDWVTSDKDENNADYIVGCCHSNWEIRRLPLHKWWQCRVAKWWVSCWHADTIQITLHTKRTKPTDVGESCRFSPREIFSRCCRYQWNHSRCWWLFLWQGVGQCRVVRHKIKFIETRCRHASRSRKCSILFA